jgi:hypothetical protein
MKVAKLVLVILAVGSILTFSNCGGDKKAAEPLPDQQLAKLSKTWKLTSVTLDTQPVTTYTNFNLTISGTKGTTSFDYATSGRPQLSPWKAGGKWSFGTDPVTQLVRDPDIATDKLDMTYSVTESTLQIQFNFQGAGYTRTSQVKGNWIFTFGL